MSAIREWRIKRIGAKYVRRIEKRGTAPHIKWRRGAGTFLIVVMPVIVAAAVVLAVAEQADDGDPRVACAPADRLLHAGQTDKAVESYQAVLSAESSRGDEVACATAGLERAAVASCERLTALMPVASEEAAELRQTLQTSLAANPYRPVACGEIDTLVPARPELPRVDLPAIGNLQDRFRTGADQLLDDLNIVVSFGPLLTLVALVVVLLAYRAAVVRIRRFDPGRIHTASFVDAAGKGSAVAEARFREAVGFIGERIGDPILAPTSGQLPDLATVPALAAVEPVIGTKAMTAVISTAAARPVTSVSGWLVAPGRLVIEAGGAASFSPRTAGRESGVPESWVYVDAALHVQREVVRRISPFGLSAPEDVVHRDLQDRAMVARIRLALEGRIRGLED